MDANWMRVLVLGGPIVLLAGCAEQSAPVIPPPPESMTQPPSMSQPATLSQPGTVSQPTAFAEPPPPARVVVVREAPPSEETLEVVRHAPPKAVDETRPTRPTSAGADYVWIPGYWVCSKDGWVWVVGRWTVVPFPGAQWSAPRWQLEGSTYRFVPGGWQ